MGQWFGWNRQRPAHRRIALSSGLAAISLALCAITAEATQLQSWRFDMSRHRLEFTTDTQVQPRVQLIPNPVRLVVDLPGVNLGRPTVSQSYNAAVRLVRVGQFDAQTARIVVELSPGYTVDPQQVKVEGASPASWSIDLPTPQAWQPDSTLPAANAAEAAPANTSPSLPSLSAVPSNTSLPNASPLTAPLPLRGAPPLNPPSSSPPVSSLRSPSPLSPKRFPLAAAPASVATLEDILISPDGLLLKTQQVIPGAKVKRIGRDVTVSLNGVIASPALLRESYRLATSYHHIQRISVRQLSAQPPVAQVTLRLERRSPDWQVSVNPAGGALLLPRGGTAARPAGERPNQTLSLLLRRTATASPRSTSRQFPSSSNRTQADIGQLATIQSVALGGSQLLVQADRPIYYTTSWEGPRYRLTLRGARWGDGIRGPQTGVGSALSDVELRQDGQNAVLLATLPPGVRVGTVIRADAQTVVLNLNRAGTTTASPIDVPPSTSPSIIPPSISRPSVYPTPSLSRPSGRRVVVIDPGHGGPDVGAIGIGGLRETNVVLPISLEVVRLLQQQGLQVYVTRTDESREVDLPPRVALAEQVRADVFVSIHANSINLSRTDINGTEVYYAPGSDSGALLSRYILDSIVRNVNMPNRGVRAARFYVIRRTSMPATLVETGFVTGAQDAPKLGDPQFQRQMAAAIVQGIIAFLNSR